MAVRFIIGRAGSGKTHHCLTAIREQLRRSPVDGPRLILLVPEQAGLQMERALLDSQTIPAAHRAEVLSFRRLAYKVLESAGGSTRQALSEPARAMVLRHLLDTHRAELHYYRRMDRAAGFVERLAATITELIQEAIDPTDLEADGDHAGDAAGRQTVDVDHTAHRAKLHDIRRIYAAYLEYLGNDRLDPSQYLQLARQLLPRCPWLAEAEVWADGFASLSVQESRTLVALAGQCHHLDITVLFDSDGIAITGGRPGRGTDRLFRKTRQTHGELHRSFVEAGLMVDDPLLLAPAPPQRFHNHPALARLERSLFRDHSIRLDVILSAAKNLPENPPAADLADHETIELVELPTPLLEVDYAVSRICHWVQVAGYRYRELAIIVRDLEPYYDLLGQALASREIPFFIDRRRPVAHHPLVELVRAATTMAAERLSLESVRLGLKTGLLPISLDAADELENYLVAHGLSGIEAWNGGDWNLTHRPDSRQEAVEATAAEQESITRINGTRQKLLFLMRPLLESAAQGVHTGSQWANLLAHWLAHVEAHRTLQRWTQQAEQEGDMDLAAEHRQVWRDVCALLDDLATALADVPLTIDELTGVLEQGLGSLTLGLAPPMVDQLLVGSIDRSRHPNLKAAVLVGFNEGVFPQALVEDAMLNDDDRDLLRRAGVRVGPPARERVLDEALLLYIACTRASEALVITYASVDGEGKPLRVSPYIHELQRACPGLRAVTPGDPWRTRQPWNVLTPRDATTRLVMEFRTRPPIVADDHLKTRAAWNELYASLRLHLRDDPLARRSFAWLARGNPAKLSPTSVQRLFGGPLTTSVSQLETYAACPFQYFAKHALGLRERAEAALAPVDVGQVHHAILEDFLKGLDTHRAELSGLSDGDLMDGLRESCHRITARLEAGGTLSNARDAYVLRRSQANLARVMQAQRAISEAGLARPRSTEVPFGFTKAGSLPALVLDTPGGRRISLRGYIDRVDLAELGDELLGIVVDYKATRNKRLNLSDVYHGISLQLPVYLLVLAEHGTSLAGRPIRPIAALYVSLASQYHLVDHPAPAENKRDAGQRGTFRPRGLLLAERFDVLDRDCTAGWSPHYNVRRRKDGEPGDIDKSDAADQAAFQATLNHTRIRLGQLADALLDGNVNVNPYRLGNFSPCTWCPMSSVCRHELGITEIRFLDSLKRSEVFQRILPPKVE